jgi:hypothetical protein
MVRRTGLPGSYCSWAGAPGRRACPGTSSSASRVEVLHRDRQEVHVTPEDRHWALHLWCQPDDPLADPAAVGLQVGFETGVHPLGLVQRAAAQRSAVHR